MWAICASFGLTITVPAEDNELLGELAGVAVSTKLVERTAEDLGHEIAADERAVVVPPETDKPVAPTLYLGVDGTGVPMRKQAVAGRKGKQPDGSSKTREAKLCTIWSAEGRDQNGVPVRDRGSVTYSAAIESAANHCDDSQPPEFTQRAIREATRRRFHQAQRRVILGDGAAWIWNLASEHFPDAIQILDRFHAKTHLADVAKSIYGSTSDLTFTWIEKRYKELDSGNITALLHALRTHAATNQDARKCLDYINANRQRMRYDKFRQQGLCTSTGVVEAGCKVVVGTRLKRTGMHWTVSGADAIIALRCCKLSGRFDDFWKRRSAQHHAAA